MWAQNCLNIPSVSGTFSKWHSCHMSDRTGLGTVAGRSLIPTSLPLVRVTELMTSLRPPPSIAKAPMSSSTTTSNPIGVRLTSTNIKTAAMQGAKPAVASRKAQREALESEVAEAVQQRDFGRAAELKQRLAEQNAASVAGRLQEDSEEEDQAPAWGAQGQVMCMP